MFLRNLLARAWRRPVAIRLGGVFALCFMMSFVNGIAQEKGTGNESPGETITSYDQFLAAASRQKDMCYDPEFDDLEKVERLRQACLDWIEPNWGVDSAEAEEFRDGLKELAMMRALSPAERFRYRSSIRGSGCGERLKAIYATIPSSEEAVSLRDAIKADAAEILVDWQKSEWHRWSACGSFRLASVLALLVGDTRSAERWVRIPAQECLSAKGFNAAAGSTGYMLGNYIQVVEVIPDSAPLRSDLLEVLYRRLSKYRIATERWNRQILQFNAYSVQASYDAQEFEDAERLFADVHFAVEAKPGFQSSIFVNLRAWIPRYEARRLHDRGDYAASREKIKAAIPLTIAAAEKAVGLPAPLLLRDLYILDASNCRMLGLEDEAKACQQQADEITAKFDALQREVKVDFDTILGEYAKQFRRR